MESKSLCLRDDFRFFTPLCYVQNDRMSTLPSDRQRNKETRGPVCERRPQHSEMPRGRSRSLPRSGGSAQGRPVRHGLTHDRQSRNSRGGGAGSVPLGVERNWRLQARQASEALAYEDPRKRIPLTEEETGNPDDPHSGLGRGTAIYRYPTIRRSSRVAQSCDRRWPRSTHSNNRW